MVAQLSFATLLVVLVGSYLHLHRYPANYAFSHLSISAAAGYAGRTIVKFSLNARTTPS